MKHVNGSSNGRSGAISPNKSPRHVSSTMGTTGEKSLSLSKSQPNFAQVENGSATSHARASHFKHSRVAGAPHNSPTKKPPVFSTGMRTREAPTVLIRPLHTADALVEYLDRNQQFLENYLMKRWTLERIEHFLKRSLGPGVTYDIKCNMRAQTNSIDQESPMPSAATTTEATDQSLIPRIISSMSEHEMLIRNLARRIHTHHDKAGILVEMVSEVIKLVDASGGNLYVSDDEHEFLSLYTSGRNQLVLKTSPADGVSNSTATSNSSNSNFGPSVLAASGGGTSSIIPVASGTYVCAYVGHTREPIRIDDLSRLDDRFPQGVFATCQTKPVKSVIAHPLLLDNSLIGVFEVYRYVDRPAFSAHHDSVVASFAQWGSLTTQTLLLYEKMSRQKELDDFILQITKSLFQDIVSMDNVIMKIMAYAKTLVNADRASLFLVDSAKNELYARIFDMGCNEFVEKKEIRFAISKGVAGYVASTGNTLNIADAYDDERFNREVDVQTQYRTRTILCMPIYIRGSVIGVVEMINKTDGSFTKYDEEAFSTFAVFCGLALHHAKLYEKIRKSEQKFKVAAEVLSYHSQASEKEVANAKANLYDSRPPENVVVSFEFSPASVDDDMKPVYIVAMIEDIFGSQAPEIAKSLDVDALVRFTLTVRKNYRNVPYHNWSHAFSVAQSMYTVIKAAGGGLEPLEMLALLISCLCHDIDHRGKTNAFMVKSATPLAALYTTSTMEQHHFHYTVSILQNEGLNILKFLTSDDYKNVLDTMKHCILATDLAKFFESKGKLKALLDSGEFSWDNPEHRKLGQGIAMTGCDLCASTKPWEVQASTVDIIFEEFFVQGDEEKRAGQMPIRMMDRDFCDELPEQQVGFFNGICLPCYELLARALPATQPMLEGARANFVRWKALADENKRRKEQMEKERQELELKEKKQESEPQKN